MTSPFLVVALFICTVGLTLADFGKSPTWGFQVTKGSDIDLICNDTEALVEPGDDLEWKNPKREAIMMNSDKYTISEHNGVDRMKLTVLNVQDADHGIYLCFVTRNNAFHVKVNRAVNYHEPKYVHVVDKYRYDIMIGGIAAAVLCVPLVVMCCVYKYRYMTSEQKELEKNMEGMLKKTHDHGVEAGPLPSKNSAYNGAGQYNKAYAESTNL